MRFRNTHRARMTSSLMVRAFALAFVSLLASKVGAQTLATMIFPTNGATINPIGNTFSWNSVSDGQAYYLYIGSAPGLMDIFSSGSLLTASIKVPNFAANTTYYITLWTQINGHWGTNNVASTFSTLPTPAVLSAPANGATGINPIPSVAFSWNRVSGATYLLLVGTTPGASNAYSSGTLTTTSVSVGGLSGLTTYYVTLTTVASNASASSTGTFTTAPILAQLSYPTNGATNIPPNNPTFTWGSVSDAQGYYLYVGTSVGTNNVFNSGVITATSIPVPNLQTATTYYVRLWTQIGGHFNNYYEDTTFSTSAGTAYVTFPANGATNVDPFLTLTWNAVSGAQFYNVNIGTTSGGSDVYSSGNVASTSLFIPGLTANVRYYVTLYTNTSSGSSSSSSVFTTGYGIAHLIAPANGATNVSPFAAFTWTSISNAQAYYVYVGSSPGAKDVDNSGALPTSVTSRLPQGLIGGQTYYVMLFTEQNGVWSSVSTSFTTATQPVPTDASTYRSKVQSIVDSVRMMTQGMTNVPTAGTLLAQITTADGGTTALCTEYAKTLEQEFLTQNISARIRHSVFDGTNTESHTFNEYYDLILNQWVLADSDFGTVYFNTSAQTGLSLQALNAAVVAEDWTSISDSIIYVSSYGDQVFTSYYMDPILLFLNPLPTASGTITLPLANSPAPFFITQSSSGTTGVYVFSFASQGETVTISDPVSGTLQMAPLGGTSYSSAVNLHSGWSITSSPSGLEILTIERVMF